MSDLSGNKLPVILTLLRISLESYKEYFRDSSQRSLEYLIFCNYFWIIIFWPKAECRNKLTVVSLRVKIGHKLNYGHHIKLCYHIMFATFGACHLQYFHAAVVLPVLSENITKTLIPLLAPYRTWFEISNCRYLRPWHFTVGEKLRWNTARHLYFITEESESWRSKVRTRGHITRSKLGLSPALHWPF